MPKETSHSVLRQSSVLPHLQKAGQALWEWKLGGRLIALCAPAPISVEMYPMSQGSQGVMF